MVKKNIFSIAQGDAIKAAITQAEKLTSGEIRLFIDDHCKNLDPVLEAGKIFQKLKMHKTKLRNGVLIYLAISDHKFAIIGDIGIHEKVGDDFWREVRELMLSNFKNNQIVEGLIAGIKKAGECLATKFPNQDDHNEISNEIVFRS
jgi:uncharacterized membrane protein